MGFGDLSDICTHAPIPLCSVIGGTSSMTGSSGVEAECYARNVELANTIIFQGAAAFAHIIALIMTVFMILHVRSKFTAVGRKEILAFFYLYMLLSFVSLLLDAGVIPPGNDVYPFFAAVQAGLVSAICVCLLINGFVGFQIYEDGTRLSIWLLRLASFVMFLITFLVALATFKGWSAGLGPTNTVGLFVVLYIFSAMALAVYFVMQVLLVVNTLQDRWPLLHISLAAVSFIMGQVILYVFSNRICNAIEHYLDGLFFATMLNLFAVMMIYKYWDSITKEDLEFSVGMKQNNWEVKELLPEDEHRNTTYQDNDYSSVHVRNSNYGGFAY